MLENKSYTVLHKILTNIHKDKIKLEADSKARATKIFTAVRDDVISKLKENGHIFKELPISLNHRGSYFGGVKVLEPDEFDLDISLKLPLDYKKIEVKNTEPGFVSLNIKNAYEEKKKTPSWVDKYSFLESFMDSEGYFSQDKLRKYTESVLTKVYGSGDFQIESDGEFLKCKFRKSGPAFTFCIQYGDNKQIDIDFVVSIQFPSEAEVWPPNPVRKFTSFPGKFASKNFWLAVPKPTKANDARSWRISFPEQEGHILYSSGHLKECYRLLKTLRTCQKWNINSYQFATLFLWESQLREEKACTAFWKNNVGYLFIYFLNKLSTALEKKELIFFWHEECNMLKEYNPSNLDNLKCRLSSIMKKIDINLNNESELEDYLRRLFHAQEREKEAGNQNKAHEILKTVDEMLSNPLTYLVEPANYGGDKEEWLIDLDSTVGEEATLKEKIIVPQNLTPRLTSKTDTKDDETEFRVLEISTKPSEICSLVDCSPSTLQLVKEGLNAIIQEVNWDWPPYTPPDVLRSRRRVLKVATHVRALIFKDIPDPEED